ncbi:flagellar basal body P-ring formation chaperone FlgA [Paraburkholderia sp. NMBU_R16]|uniref:flagellar basal body P-ring formation chaperone FlgA n=1 Tax=Paraburkholderia sp. NMBU_R16 TaxID=2698676 RepID=UPI0020B8E0A9|nr:flagellar basal body P-ring formation chaperone FlgA [Paraburkholderia sp. NMBU_R16]
MSLFAATAVPRSARPAAVRTAPERASRTLAGAVLGLAASVVTCLGLGLGLATAAHAQQTGGTQIYIPGPGERSATPAAPAVGTLRATNDGSEAPGGMITIPGPGERPVQPGATTGVITIPGPGEQAAAQPASRSALPHVAAMQAASRVIPVVVTPSPRATRAAQPIPIDRPASAGGPSAAATNGASQAARLAATATPAQTAARTVETTAPATNAAPTPVAAAVPAGPQDGESVRRTALTFLQQQSAGLPGKITITVAPAFPRGLASCTTLVPFMPPGARLWGRTTVGVRCAGERPWTLYLQARVSLESTYYLAARQIEPGAVVSAADLMTREGDLANLPRTIVTDPSQAVGAVALARIGAGSPLREDMLRTASSVTIGQTVKVIAVGTGFSISSEGAVMNNASPGQQVRVKTAAGQIISGIVKDGSTVEIQM